MSVGRFVLVFWAFFVATLASASAPLAEPAITFEWRAWSAIEGAPAGAWAITQSVDGMLWLASPGGLYRYDGERFSKVTTIHGHSLRSSNVSHVASLQNGIAVLYQFGGMSIFTQQSAYHYGTKDGLPSGKLDGLLQTADGQLYVGTPLGLAMLHGDRWEVLSDTGLPQGPVDSIVSDPEGTLWVAAEKVLYARKAAGGKFVQVMAIASWRKPEITLGKLHVMTPDGQDSEVEFGKRPVVQLDHLDPSTDSVFEGPLSTMWAWLTGRGGLVRLKKQADGKYVFGESLNSNKSKKTLLLATFIDREGNLWLSTTNGVEKLRAQRIHEIAIADSTFFPYVHKGLGDSLLISGLSTVDTTRLNASGDTSRLGVASIQAMWRENEDSVWAGSPSGLFHITREGVTQWPLPGKPMTVRVVQAITVDNSGQVWVSVTRTGLYRFSAGRWTLVDTSVMGADAIPVTMLASASGSVWLGFTNGRIGELQNGVVRAVSLDLNTDLGNVLSLIQINGNLIAGGEKGLAWLNGKVSKPVLPEQLDAFRGISGMSLDHQGNLWAHGADGIFRIAKDELDKLERNAAEKLRWQLFSLSDGVRGSAVQIRPLPTLTVANDGRVFYATNSQVAWIDPKTLRKNERAPDILMLGLKAGNEQMQPKSGMLLKAGTNAVEIKYAVTALSVPEKVQIKYRLSGVDNDWQIPSGERVARYTNLEPGNYSFQVIASNEDGVWNTDGATLRFEILPKFWQTQWFHLLLVVLALAAIGAVHRWRISTALARAAARTAGQMEERERIARNLHDTLLQGVQALILRSSTVLNRLPKGSQEEQILDSVLGQAEKLVDDTRVEVMALRDNQSADQIFTDMFKELQVLAPNIEGRLKLDFPNNVGRIRRDVAREVCQVFKEAITNAARHSRATEIRASLMVSAAGIAGAVVDNGEGIPDDIAHAGIPGHWGIIGMRERLSKLGGTIIIDSDCDAGTALRFTLDATSSFD